MDIEFESLSVTDRESDDVCESLGDDEFVSELLSDDEMENDWVTVREPVTDRVGDSGETVTDVVFIGVVVFVIVHSSVAEPDTVSVMIIVPVVDQLIVDDLLMDNERLFESEPLSE